MYILLNCFKFFQIYILRQLSPEKLDKKNEQYQFLCGKMLQYSQIVFTLKPLLSKN